MHQITGNLHLHTNASDGTGTHDEVAAAAVNAGLDFIIYTDHNTWVDGVEGWYKDPQSGKEVLRFMGQEVNDQALEPELNHMLCHFVSSNLNDVAANPQTLIDTATERGGLTFLAHPLERPGYAEAAQTYPWISWDISGYTGVEIWNAMTDAKWRLRTLPRGIAGGYLPKAVFTAPFPEMLTKWDELLATGEKVVAVGSSDAHAWPLTWKKITRTFFPYELMFSAINTHLLLNEPLSRNVDQAKTQIYTALKSGHCFVSNDLVASPRGFSFTAESGTTQAIMGDTLSLQSEAVLRVNSPHKAKIRLIKDGQLISESTGKRLEYRTGKPGVYRVEMHRWYWLKNRGWVYSNPIYVR